MDVVVIVISSWTSPLIFCSELINDIRSCSRKKHPYGEGREFFAYWIRFFPTIRVENWLPSSRKSLYLARINYLSRIIVGIIHVYESTTEREKRELVILFWYEFSNRTFEQREEVKFVDKNLVANFSLKLSFHTRRGAKWEKSVETWKFVEF